MSNLRALEHKGETYVHVIDLQKYVSSRADKVQDRLIRDVLYQLVYKLNEVRAGRPDSALAPRV